MSGRHALISLLICLAMLAGCAFVNVSLIARPGPLEEQVVSGKGAPKILLTDITGLISSEERKTGLVSRGRSMVDALKEQLKKAEDEKELAGVIVRINSPGGTVTASDIIFHELMEFKKKKDVPVYAVMMGIGTSGGYYASLAADRIYAHPTTITGSIGVLAVKMDFSGLMEKVGVEEKTVKSGNMKDIFSPFRPDTPEEQKVMQDIIDQLFGRFVDAVAEGREGELTRDEITVLADGRPYTARQALEAGLIDEIGYLEDAIEAMKKERGIDQASVVTYVRPGEYKNTIYAAGPFENSGTINVVNVDTEGIVGLPGVSFLYLWTGY